MRFRNAALLAGVLLSCTSGAVLADCCGPTQVSPAPGATFATGDAYLQNSFANAGTATGKGIAFQRTDGKPPFTSGDTVVPLDGVAYNVSASSAAPLVGTGTNQTTGAVSTVGYGGVSVQLTNAGTSTVTTFEVSLDGTNWYPVNLAAVNSSGGQSPTSSVNSANLYYGNVSGNFFRVRVSTYGSGTPTAVIALKAGVFGTTAVFSSAAATFAGQNLTASGTASPNANGAQGTTNGVGIGIGATASANGINVTSGVFRLASSAATTNLSQVKASAGRVYRITGNNTAAGPRRIKFYNALAANVTPGTTLPVLVKYLPTNAAFSFDAADIGWYFPTAISFSISQTSADNDTSGVAAGDITDLSVEFQ